MLDWANSKLMVDLKNGKLPEVTIDNASILTLSGYLTAGIIVAILFYFIAKKLSNQ